MVIRTLGCNQIVNSLTFRETIGLVNEFGLALENNSCIDQDLELTSIVDGNLTYSPVIESVPFTSDSNNFLKKVDLIGTDYFTPYRYTNIWYVGNSVIKSSYNGTYIDNVLVDPLFRPFLTGTLNYWAYENLNTVTIKGVTSFPGRSPILLDVSKAYDNGLGDTVCLYVKNGSRDVFYRTSSENYQTERVYASVEFDIAFLDRGYFKDNRFFIGIVPSTCENTVVLMSELYSKALVSTESISFDTSMEVDLFLQLRELYGTSDGITFTNDLEVELLGSVSNELQGSDSISMSSSFEVDLLDYILTFGTIDGEDIVFGSDLTVELEDIVIDLATSESITFDSSVDIDLDTVTVELYDAQPISDGILYPVSDFSVLLYTVQDSLSDSIGFTSNLTLEVEDVYTPIELDTVTESIVLDSDMSYDLVDATVYLPGDFTLNVNIPVGAPTYTLKVSTPVKLMVDWGDGNTEQVTVSNKTHTYALPGIYDIHVYDVETFSSISFTDQHSLIGVSGELPNQSNVSTMFSGCINLTDIVGSIFNNYTGLYFSQTFKDCEALESIPAGLFSSNINVTSFNQTFYGCISLTTIPAGLFSSNINVTSFYQTFYGCISLTTIPSNLFDNNTNVTTFEATFQVTGIVSIPIGLFSYNINVTNFSITFGNCTSLTSIPTDIFSNNLYVNNFTAVFSYCSNETRNVPELWVSHPRAGHFWSFRGCTNASNYASIPNDWK